MGYYVHYEFDNVKIKKENEVNCLKAINDLSSGINHQWVDAPKEDGYQSLRDAFESWRFDITYSDEYFWLDEFSGEKLGDENLLFETIAPFVESGGFIYGRGEDGCFWRIVFIDGTCKEQEAKITYE